VQVIEATGGGGVGVGVAAGTCVGSGVGGVVGGAVFLVVGFGVGLGVGPAFDLGVDRGVATGATTAVVFVGLGLVTGGSEEASSVAKPNAGPLVALRTSPPGPRRTRMTASATTPTTRTAAIAASRRCSATGSAASQRRRRTAEPRRASRAGRTPMACNRDAETTNREGSVAEGRVEPDVPPPPERNGRPLTRRSAHIPIDSSTIRGRRARPASSRGTKRAAIAAKPRTTSAPTSHSTALAYPTSRCVPAGRPRS
jgi:hypothetical protein